LQDYELLELFLFNSIPRRDVKPIAKELMAKFGNLGEVCAAPIHRLVEVKGIGEKTALDAMQFEPVEQFRVLFLDRKNRLIADEILGKGTIDRAPVYPREIVKRGLALEASAIILAHNHPSGDSTPSQSDIDMTFMIVETCNAVGISVHDHLVIGREEIASFKILGLM